VAVVAVGFLSARGVAGFYTDYLWFSSLGFSGVFTKVLTTRIILGVVFALVAAGALFVNLVLADRMAPKERLPGPEEELIERYQQIVGPRAWLLRSVVAGLFGLVAGAPVSGRWQDWLLFRNSVSFGITDKQFGRDIGFYVFRLPFLSFLVDWLFAVLIISVLITAVVHYLNGGIRMQVQGGRHVTPQVKLHLSALLAVLALLKAAGYWLQRYTLTTSTRGYRDGAGYTDVKAQLPAIQLLMLISLLAAVLLIVNVWQRGFRLPVIAVGLWGLVAIIAGAIYPAFVQRFVVDNATSDREAPYIQRNIDATRQAFGISDVKTISYPASIPSADALKTNVANIENTRLLDPQSIPDAFRRLERKKSFYDFTQVDVDRYPIAGKEQQVVIGVREVDPSLATDATSWEAKHLAYTHGYSVAMAPGGEVTAAGDPSFLTIDDKGTDGPALTQPAVYFGETVTNYAVVNTKRGEVTLSPDASSQTTTQYKGSGGVLLNSTIRRAAFALRFGEINLLNSSLITPESRIQYIRDVRSRVKKVAPFLQFDADPYPVLVDGRIKWIVDGYTTTSRYPYSQRADTGSDRPSAGSGLSGRYNYVRNSVKAVVDAYEGDVKMYIVDPTDPIVKAYAKAFPSLFSPASAVPATLADHFRYPEDLFKIQTTMYGRYRLTDAKQFFQSDNAWGVSPPVKSSQDRVTGSTVATTAASDTVSTDQADRVQPYYALLQLPGAEKPQFVLVRTFVPNFTSSGGTQQSTADLRGIMTVSSDPGSYGKLSVLEVTGSTPGPAFVANRLSSDFASQLTLLDQNGSSVVFGDLQLVPLGDSLAYVRPWFVRAAGANAAPQLRNVSVTLGQNSYLGTSLEDALRQAFGTDAGVQTVVGGSDTTTPTTSPSSGGTTSTTTPSSSTTLAPGSDTVEGLLKQAQQAYDQAQIDYKNGDLTKWKNELDQAYKLAAQAASKATGTTVTAVPASSTTVPSSPTTVSSSSSSVPSTTSTSSSGTTSSTAST
jgi:uncharacterized membrane protein (UPF0182 family)